MSVFSTTLARLPSAPTSTVVFQVLHSSAGAGKTHALVKHYLRAALASEDPAAYTRILALTFTNKAAGEMRERVIDYLEGLAGGGELSIALTDVHRDLISGYGLSPDQVRDRASRTLVHVLHHWPQLAISTIDAFTRRVVMPFARDLRLDSELRMTTEELDYRDMAVDRLLEEAGTDPALTELLITICEDLVGDDLDWRADKPLRALATQLTKEQAILHLHQLRELGSAHFLAIRLRLRSETRAFKERIRALGSEVLEAIADADLTHEDLYFGQTGPISYFRALATFEDWLDEKKNTQKAFEKDKWASDKTSPEAKAAVERLAPLFRKVINEVEHLRVTDELKRHAVACAVLRDLLPAAALHLLDERLEIIKREEGVTFFSDLVKKVADIAQREPAPFLYERLGDRYRHFVIDEFQDTSMLQWHALLPLITNALSSGGSAFLVGDAKQAIYRWRNGEARQFTRLPRLFGKEHMADGDAHEAALVRAYQPVDPLTENFRSARAIIRFNNHLFDALRNTLPEDYRAVYQGQAQQEVKNLDGYVYAACSTPAAKDEESSQDAPAAAKATIDALRSAIEDGFAPGQVAVLVRTKAQARTIARHLVSSGYTVVSPDGLTLGADSGARSVIGVLAWTIRPDDVTAAQAVQFMAMLQGSDATLTEDLAAPAQRMRMWQQERALVRAHQPLPVLILAIVRELQLDPARDGFVMGLLEATHAFIAEHGDDASAFLDHWNRTASDRTVSVADNLNAVRVMTVHTSKGLQFPVVIVPYADMAARGPKDRIWIDARAVASDLPAALVKPAKMLEAIGIPELVAEDELSRLDLMDLFYVALTRPEQRLYLFFDGARKSGIGYDARTVLKLEPGGINEYGGRSPAVPSNARKTNDQVLLSPGLSTGPARITVREEAPENWDPWHPDPARAHGQAMHAILARVRLPEDLPNAIDVEAPVWGIGAAEKTRIHDHLAEMLAKPEVLRFFAPGLSVRTEATLIDRDGRAHRPDRVSTDGVVTRVLDIKTGSPAHHHHDQVATYLRLLREAEGIEVTGHLLYVADAAIVDVHDRAMDSAP